MALQNDVEATAKVLPRRPEDVCFTVSHRGMWHKVRPLKIRQALDFFKSSAHPAFIDIENSEENHDHLCAVVQNDKDLYKEGDNDTSTTDIPETSGSHANFTSSQPLPVRTDQNIQSVNIEKNTTQPEEQSAAQRLRDKGQN